MFPKVIYKYRNWFDENHKNVLKLNELYFASPRQFNDPYDCRITESYYLMLNSESDKKSYIDMLRARDSEYLKSIGLDVEVVMKDIRDKLDSPDKLKEFQKEKDAKYFEYQDKHYGIISFSITWDDIVLWSHYADYHKGYCIGFYEEKFRNSGRFGRGGKVNYKKDKPQIHPLDNDFLFKAFIETHSKFIQWKREKEYRLSKLFFPQVPSDFDRKITFTDDYIKEIIIGSEATEKTLNEILSITKQRNIITYKMEKLRIKYKLIKRLI